MHLLVARARGAPLAGVAGDPMAEPLQPGQLFDVDMNHVSLTWTPETAPGC